MELHRFEHDGGTTTVGQLTLTAAMPSGYNITAITAGAGWTCTGTGTQTMNCTTSQAVIGGNSFPVVTVSVQIPANSPSSVTSTTSTWGGGDPIHTSAATSAAAASTVTVSSSPVVTLSATSLAFGTETVGDATASQSVTLTNTGQLSLTISSIVLGGPNPSSFVFANSCGATLAAGANCSIHGHFAPTTTGALTATITITDNATGSPQSIALSGTGQ